MSSAPSPSPRLAAVVLNYRTPVETAIAARALLGSRRAVQDLIVVDNGSEDGSEAQLRAAVPEAHVLQTGANLGFSGGCNVGIREALRRGAELVLLINSDLVLAPDAIGYLEGALDSRPTAGVAGPMVLVESDPGRIESMGISFSPTTGRTRHRGFGARAADVGAPEPCEVDGVSGSAMLIRRQVFERIGPLTEEYFFSFEDLDYCLRASRAGFVTLCVGRAKAYHKGGHSLGARSARRLYFATRNHLLMVSRVAPAPGPVRGAVRNAAIVARGIFHAVVRADVPRGAGVRSVLRGAWDHARRRYGSGG